MGFLRFLFRLLVGLLALVGLVAVGALGTAFWLYHDFGAFERPEAPRGATVLLLDTFSGFAEQRSDSALAALSDEAPVLREVVAALDAAAEDDNVRGIVARVGLGPLGLTQVQELRLALARFRASGKFAIAHSETFGEGGDGTLHYYLASAFDEVWLQPSGLVDATGFSLKKPFLGEALSELDIVARVAQRKEAKGAASFLTERRMPEAERQNLGLLVDSWLAQFLAGVGEDRGLAPDAVRAQIDRGPLLAKEALDAGLIDRLAYWDETEEEGLERAGDGAEYYPLGDYARNVAEVSNWKRPEEGATVALIHGLGAIVIDGNEDDGLLPESGVLSAGELADTIAEAAADPEVDAILLRIDSPGGSYVGSDRIWREVSRAVEDGVPVVVSMGEVAASGGYFVAAPASKIVALPGTVTGSIGTVSGKLVLSDFWRNYGIAWDGVSAGAQADFWSMNQDFDEAGWARLNATLDAVYSDFAGKVAEGRKLSPEAVEALARGQVWSGSDALERGLVDALGGWTEAIELARAEADFPEDAPVILKPFPPPRDLWESLIADVERLPGLYGEETRLARALAPLLRVVAPLVAEIERSDKVRIEAPLPR